ncbi:MAG: laccase domain-containing protein [Acidimicrobiia bacterium]
MIRPPAPTIRSGSGRSGSGQPGSGRQWDWGAAFSDASEGDLRQDLEARGRFAARLGIPSEWAIVAQVHGARVLEVDQPGEAGEGDAMFTTSVGVPLAVFTADCAGVVLGAEGAVGVAHAGWRGAAAGVVGALADRMRGAGYEPRIAAIGPTIGSCCLEVGPEVSAELGGFTSETSWGTPSVDLIRSISSQLPGVEIWRADVCTRHQAGWYSHRSDRTLKRMAALGWLM